MPTPADAEVPSSEPTAVVVATWLVEQARRLQATVEAEVRQLRDEIATLRGENPYAAAVIDRMRAHAGEINDLRVSLDLAVAERDEARARIADVRELHRPADGLGYLGDGTYGAMSPVCSTCGKDDEYGVWWPCPTIKALDGQEAPDAR